ncbi:MAG: hypothetical protein RL227_341 [Pseudomonadota bacterium]
MRCGAEGNDGANGTAKSAKDDKRGANKRGRHEVTAFEARVWAAGCSARKQPEAQERQASWAFTFSTMLLKPAGSWMAMSDRTLRSMSICAFFRPAMNLL